VADYCGYMCRWKKKQLYTRSGWAVLLHMDELFRPSGLFRCSTGAEFVTQKQITLQL